MASNTLGAESEVTNSVFIEPNHRTARLKSLGGSQSDAWNNLLTNQAIQALWTDSSEAGAREVQLNATVAALIGIAPKDELEGMMAAQLIAAHNATMECYRRAMISDQTLEGRRENLSQANKLSRTYAALIEALNRHRGKGQQKVTVEHVHVYSGGQAIVGAMGAPGGGDQGKLEKQPHAQQIADAPQSALRGSDATAHSLPIARHEKRPMPDARRQLTRRSKRK